MQQTEKYQFNLIEPSDVFSPEPLNQNMEKTEEQFTAEAAARQSADGALERRIAVLEAHKVVVGSYTRTSAEGFPFIVDVGFSPTFITIHSNTGSILLSALGSTLNTVTFTTTGFRIITENWARENIKYYYIAVL